MYEWIAKANQAVKEKTADLVSKYESGELSENLQETLVKARTEAQKRLVTVKEKYESGELKQEAGEKWNKVLQEVPLLDQLNKTFLVNMIGGDDGQLPRSVQLVYLTERIVAMPLPGKGGHTIQGVADLLTERHGDNYMVYNISEEKYDYSKFNNQVLEFNFPGHPAPPLGLLFKICSSLENWLDADPNNVAVVHCQTGKGRTSTVLACLLAWLCEIHNPNEALQYIADTQQTTVDRLAIPSQRRYVQYFGYLLEGHRPRSEPLLLRRCIMNTIPRFSTRDGVPIKSDDFVPDGVAELGCVPYLQIFKGGVLVFTTTWKQPSDDSGVVGVPKEKSEEGSSSITLPWASESDGSVAFPVDTVVQGDILVRCRHLCVSGARVSMFRAAFHTGYISSGILRLNKSQLDGACNDGRFQEDFFIDLIFAPIEKETSSAPSPGKDEAQKQTIGEAGLKIKKSDAGAYDAMLLKDKKMWDQIQQRKALRLTKQQKMKLASSTPEPTQKFSITGAPMEKMYHEEEVDFASPLSIPSTEGSGIVPPAPPSFSNRDLLQQLAAAELETTEGQPSATQNDNLQEPAIAAPAVQTSSQFSDELSALEELEKELGLEGLTLSSPILSAETGGDDAPRPPIQSIDFDDDLEGLEDYLQTLTSTAK